MKDNAWILEDFTIIHTQKERMREETKCEWDTRGKLQINIRENEFKMISNTQNFLWVGKASFGSMILRILKSKAKWINVFSICRKAKEFIEGGIFSITWWISLVEEILTIRYSADDQKCSESIPKITRYCGKNKGYNIISKLWERKSKSWCLMSYNAHI